MQLNSLVLKDKKLFLPVVCFFLLMAVMQVTNGQQLPIVFNHNQPSVEIGSKSFIFIDTANLYNATSIRQVKNEWQQKKNNPIVKISNGTAWVKFSVVNKSLNPNLYFHLQYSNISYLTLYRQLKGNLQQIAYCGNALAYKANERTTPNFIFTLTIAPGDTAKYYLKIKSFHPLLLPAFISSADEISNSENIQVIIIGIYAGIMFSMLFYNLFIFFSTRDKSYLIYVVFLLFLFAAQFTVSGNSFKFFWPSHPGINRYALIITSALAGISGIGFGINFLQLKRFMPGLRWVFVVLLVIYLGSIVCSLVSFNLLAYDILNFNGLFGGILLLVASGIIARRGYKPAYFYFVAWFAFLFGMVVFVMRNLAIIPNNYVTTYILYIGSSIEVIVLSIALADKINTLRKEKEQSQAIALAASLKNEQLVKEQNVLLENSVLERTSELQLANQQLSDAFTSLKETQLQLVEAEKMASLGQLTAGIAHEINNPINFVKSNIKPLVLDINDLCRVIDAYSLLHTTQGHDIVSKLKDVQQLSIDLDIDYLRSEIVSLTKGIEDGADRTSEIVRSLRNFSRLDESQVKTVNVHEGLESTLILLRNTMVENIRINKNFMADGEIECYPGKLNQVFMNILNNAIQAIKLNDNAKHEEFIYISTNDVEDDKIEIRIKDTGPGMNTEVKQKIFDPFFTTKDVGEGTGLGLAIVFKIVQEHNGKIEVNSIVGKGAEFVITLHRSIPMRMPL